MGPSARTALLLVLVAMLAGALSLWRPAGEPDGGLLSGPTHPTEPGGAKG